MRALFAILASIVLVGCQLATSPSPADPSPTRCVGLIRCSATPGPIRTLPPVQTRPPGPTTGTSAETFRVAIGACLRYSPGGTALGDIALHGPDLMLWLGDNIYADTEDMTVMRELYDALGANPRFQALSAATETMAVWDDHDYGWNNANATWPHKDAAKEEFLRFWGAAPDDPRWEQPGVYSSRIFGTGERSVQVILLDNRYNLDPSGLRGRRSGPAGPWRGAVGLAPGPACRAGDRRGSSQAGSRSSKTTTSTPSGRVWGDSPHERERLFRVIREMGVPGVLFVSGDMHFSELTRHPDDAAALGYATYDLTPSGLDQIETAGEGQWGNPNRIGELLNSNRKYGMVEIDWALPDPEIHLEIYDGRDLFVHHVVRLSELQPGGASG